MKKIVISIILFSVAQFFTSSMEINILYGIKPYWLGQAICSLINIGLLVVFYFMSGYFYFSLRNIKRYKVVKYLIITNAIEVMVFLFPLILTYVFDINRNLMLSMNVYNLSLRFYISITMITHLVCIYLGIYSVSNTAKIVFNICVFILISVIPVIRDRSKKCDTAVSTNRQR